MFVAASTRCFADKNWSEALCLIDDLEYDKVELWFSPDDSHLNPVTVAEDPERFVAEYREVTRMTPLALCLESDVAAEVLGGLTKLAKLLRVTQITVPASPLGTPFNTEIDRLRAFQEIAGEHGIRLSIKTKTGDLTEDPHTAVELCQSVRGLGLTLDPSYYLCGSNRGKPYDQVYPYVYHVHLRDSTPDNIQVKVGLGEIDYSRLVNQLRRENYAGTLAVDLLQGVDDETRALEMRKLRMLLDTLL